MFDSDYTGFVPSNPIWVEEPTFYNYQHFYYTTPFTTSTTTTQKPKKLRKKLKVKLKKKPTKKVIENAFYLSEPLLGSCRTVHRERCPPTRDANGLLYEN